MGGADFASIAAALRAARPGDTIVVLPGRYAEELMVEQSVTLLGKGAREAIVIEGRAAPVLRCTAGSLRVENLTLRQGGGKNLDCVAVTGGSCTLIGCDVSAETAGACVNLGSRDDALLRSNVIHDGGGWGVFIGGTGVVTLEENEITAHAYSGVTVMRDGYVLARRNRIMRNAQHAVRLYAGGGGAFEDNDLRGNYLATWNIEPGSYGKLLRERNKG
jgi:nitrous oxidase accessory protein NosD